jgi:hypothetical protein
MPRTLQTLRSIFLLCGALTLAILAAMLISGCGALGPPANPGITADDPIGGGYRFQEGPPDQPSRHRDR